MKVLLAALLAVTAPLARGIETSVVRRGDLVVRIKVSGTVVTEDIFRLKSTLEGRVESVLASTNSWSRAGQPLALLAGKEMAAILDARGSQDPELLEDRWQRVFRPAPVRCPGDCFVLKVFAKAKAWMKPQAVLFEAAAKLKLVARVRPEDVQWVKDGQILTFWSLKDPARKHSGRVTRFILDVQGEKTDPGAGFALYLSPDRFFVPGTEWEGEIIAHEEKGAIIVPTNALIRSGDAVYLTVRVSTGLTIGSMTQITAGVEEGRELLILDDAQLQGAERHHQAVDRPAVERRRSQPADAAAGEPQPQPRRPAPIDDKDYGDDPYGEP